MLVNAAREPEIVDLARCLMAMGADIEGAGTDRIRIRGVANAARRRRISVIPDRIETGTYMMAAAITGGAVELVGARRDLVAAVARILEGAGVEVDRDAGRHAGRAARNGRLTGVDVMTEPFPGLPDRSAGADDGADGDGRGRRDDHRDDLREPLHARARALPHGRRHQCARRLGDGARRAAARRARR